MEDHSFEDKVLLMMYIYAAVRSGSLKIMHEYLEIISTLRGAKRRRRSHPNMFDGTAKVYWDDTRYTSSGDPSPSDWFRIT
jgi:hypothetical protein